jgi:hypothetical protein
MAARSSEDSGISRPHFDFSAPSPIGYFDNLFTLPRHRLSNPTPFIISDLQKTNPKAFYARIFGITDDDSTLDTLSTDENSLLYVGTVFSELYDLICIIFSSERNFPSCPSPDFLGSHDTYRSMYHIPIVSKPIANVKTNIPLWKVQDKPIQKLEQGLFIQGRFGQGVILNFSHKNWNFRYFNCYTYNDGPILLAVPTKWQRFWQKIFLSTCNAVLSRS